MLHPEDEEDADLHPANTDKGTIPNPATSSTQVLKDSLEGLEPDS